MTKKELKEIRAMLLVADVTFAGLAREFHVSRQTVYNAVKEKHDSKTSKEIRAYIESIIGHVEVWHI